MICSSSLSFLVLEDLWNIFWPFIAYDRKKAESNQQHQCSAASEFTQIYIWRIMFFVPGPSACRLQENSISSTRPSALQRTRCLAKPCGATLCRSAALPSKYCARPRFLTRPSFGTIEIIFNSFNCQALWKCHELLIFIHHRWCLTCLVLPMIFIPFNIKLATSKHQRPNSCSLPKEIAATKASASRACTAVFWSSCPGRSAHSDSFNGRARTC